MFDLLRNTGWVGVRAVMKGVSTLVVTLFLVRYLEPELFGTYSLTIALARFTEAAHAWSNPTLLIRDLAATDDDTKVTGQILGSACVNLLLSIATWLLLLSSAYLFFGHLSNLLSQGVVIVAASAIFSPANCFQAYFQSKLDSRPLAIIQTATTAFSLVSTIAAITLHAHTIWLFVILPATAGLNCLLSYVVFRSQFARLPPPVDWKYGFLLARESLPYVVSSLAVITYAKADQLLLGMLATRYELGQYAAIVRIAEALDLIPVTISTTALPKLSKIREHHHQQYQSALTSFYQIVFLTWQVAAVPICLFATPLVCLLFGEQFQIAGDMLPVYMVAQFCGVAGICRSVFITNERLVQLNVPLSLMGAIINVTLNLWLIPHCGAWGATWSTVVTYSFTCVTVSFFVRSLRPIAIIPIQCLNVIGSFRSLLNLASK